MSVGEARNAIVIGASMAGLLAARVLTDHFEAVTLIERDRLPEPLRRGAACPRHGTPIFSSCAGAELLTDCSRE